MTMNTWRVGHLGIEDTQLTARRIAEHITTSSADIVLLQEISVDRHGDPVDNFSPLMKQLVQYEGVVSESEAFAGDYYEESRSENVLTTKYRERDHMAPA